MQSTGDVRLVAADVLVQDLVQNLAPGIDKLEVVCAEWLAEIR
jgi:hypothetical protein